MESKELEMLWKRCDEKFDDLEETNKKLLKERLLQIPKKKLKRIKSNILQSIFAVLLVFLSVWNLLRHSVKIENVDWIVILGCILVIVSMLFFGVRNVKFFLISKEINLSSDTIVQTFTKISKVKSMSKKFRKDTILYFPVLFIGFILLFWHNIDFNLGVITSLGVLFIVVYWLGITNAGSGFKDKITELEEEIVDKLEEYTTEEEK